MAVAQVETRPIPHGPSWKWWICGLLLLATMLNYMDRITINLTALRIMDDFCLTAKDYGRIESAFALAFALGAIVGGYFVDRWNVRWLYPTFVVAWSAAGFAAGLVQGYLALLLCRFWLGCAEAGNWPCALKTTQRILPPAQRSLGNSILQSGAAVGAILTPLVVLLLVPWSETWRWPFLVLGAIGLIWVVFWMEIVRPSDLAPPTPAGGALAARPSFWQSILPLVRIAGQRRFWVLITVVVSINIAWHYFRAWLPLFLQKKHGYGEEFTALFITGYYVATVIGTLTAGAITSFLVRAGFSVHASRVLVFAGCAGLTSLSLVAALLPAGWLLLTVLLIIGFAALGLFPNYYSFSQELTTQHQGKVTGTLGCTNWIAMAVLHELVGESIKRTGSYDLGVAAAGLAPLVGLAALLLFWGKGKPQGNRG